MEQSQQDQLSDLNLQVDGDVRQHLGNTVKWTKFIAVSIFIFCGVFLLAVIAASTAITTMVKKMSAEKNIQFLGDYPMALLVGVVLFVLLVVGFIYFFLYNFSVKMKNALLNEDVVAFNNSLSALKTFFIVTTIFAILSLLTNIYNLFA